MARRSFRRIHEFLQRADDLISPTGDDTDGLTWGTLNNAPLFDKDGVARPLDGRNSGAGAYDIGAFEFISSFADTDHDGMADLSEIIAGTSPVDSHSVLKLQGYIDVAQHQVVMRWPSVVGRSYKIEFKSSVDPGDAWDVLEESITGSGSLIERRDPISADMRFYRLSVLNN